jgi:chromosome segregation ATPase
MSESKQNDALQIAAMEFKAIYRQIDMATAAATAAVKSLREGLADHRVQVQDLKARLERIEAQGSPLVAEMNARQVQDLKSRLNRMEAQESPLLAEMQVRLNRLEAQERPADDGAPATFQSVVFPGVYCKVCEKKKDALVSVCNETGAVESSCRKCGYVSD